jgi:segregation and condensation protein A
MPDDGAGDDVALFPVRPAGDALWDDWDVPPRVPSAPVLHLDGFDGPIDLLLDLAERQRLDLGRISLVELVDQFVNASAQLVPHVPIERRADWLVMATRLVLLRSRLLFPATSEAAEAAEREAGREVARIEDLRFVRAAASWLQARPYLGHDVFARAPSGPNPQIASYMALMEACLTVLCARDEQQPDEAVYRPVIPDLFRIPEALRRMRATLAEITGVAPFEAFLPHLPRTAANRALLARSAVGSTFMAALELARGAELTLEQDAAFQVIIVTPLVTPVPEPGAAQAHE